MFSKTISSLHSRVHNMFCDTVHNYCQCEPQEKLCRSGNIRKTNFPFLLSVLRAPKQVRKLCCYLKLPVNLVQKSSTSREITFYRTQNRYFLRMYLYLYLYQQARWINLSITELLSYIFEHMIFILGSKWLIICLRKLEPRFFLKSQAGALQ